MVLIFSFQSLEAQMNSEMEASYTGGYTKSDMESVSQLMILEDHTFCYLFMGGSVDLAAVGYWKLNSNQGAGIVLNEVRLQTQIFPVYIKKAKSEDNKVRFIFDGYSMSNANRAVFTISKTDNIPTQFRPLFEEGQSYWREEYELPLMDAGDIKYFYLGFVEVDRFDNPLKLQVFQYKYERGINENMLSYSSSMNEELLIAN